MHLDLGNPVDVIIFRHHTTHLLGGFDFFI